MLDKYLGLGLECVCVRVCKAPEQMVGDVRLRQTIDFRKQISSLVKQKAPLGPREGRREGGTGGGREGEREGQTRLSNLCHRQNPKPGKGRARERGEQTAPFELHYRGGTEGGGKRRSVEGKEERIMGLMPADTQQRRWGLITHTHSSLWGEPRCEARI